MSKFEDMARWTSMSKAAMDAVEACKLYDELLRSGWPKDKAFMLAFMGIQVLFIPGLKPLPEPDPPYFTLSTLYQAVEEAQANATALKTYIDAQLKFLKAFMAKQGGIK